MSIESYFPAVNNLKNNINKKNYKIVRFSGTYPGGRPWANCNCIDGEAGATFKLVLLFEEMAADAPADDADSPFVFEVIVYANESQCLQ